MTALKQDLVYQKINQIQALTTDIQHLHQFLSDLETFKDEKIIKVFIVTEKKHSIELIGHFTAAASKSLFNLIINSRSKIIEELNRILKDFVSSSGSDIKPNN